MHFIYVIAVVALVGVIYANMHYWRNQITPEDIEKEKEQLRAW